MTDKKISELPAATVLDEDDILPATQVDTVTRYITVQQLATIIQTIIGGGAYTDENARDAIALALTDSATIDFSANDPGDTITAVIKAASIDNTHVAAALISGQTAKTSMASADYLLLYDTAATALKKILWSNLVGSITINYDALPTRMLQTSSATPTSSTAGYPICFNPVTGYFYVMSSASSNVNQISLRTGLSTHISVPVTAGASAASYYSATLDRVIVSGGNGFALLNANTGVCGSLVTPTSWNVNAFFYDEPNDLVYYCPPGGSTVVRRCSSNGGSAAASNVIAGATVERAIVVGSTVYVLDTGNDQVHKMTAWPAVAASVSVGVSLSSGANRGFKYIPQSGKIWVGTDGGLIKVIDPATMTVVQTITLFSGTVYEILVHPTTSKNIVYVCNASRFYAIDAITGTILDFIVWTTGSPTAVAFDTNIAQLGVAYNGATALQRCTA